MYFYLLCETEDFRSGHFSGTKIKRESENCGVGLLHDDESKCASLLSSDCLLSPVAFFSAVDYDHTSTRARSPSGLNCMSWRDTCLQYETEEIKHCYDFSDMTFKPSINPIRNSAPNSSMTGTGTGRSGGGGGGAEVVKKRDERQGQMGKDFGFSGNEGNKDANKGKLIGTGLMKEIKEEEGRDCKNVDRRAFLKLIRERSDRS